MSHLRRAVRQFYILLLPICLWLFILVHWAIDMLPFDTVRILYGLIVFHQATGLYVLLASVFSFWILLIVLPTIRHGFNSAPHAAFRLSLIMAFIAIPGSCWASGVAFEFRTTFTHVVRINHGQYLYQVAFISNPMFGQSSYNLYRCDSIGIICDRVYHLDSSSGTPFEAIGNYQAAGTAKLSVDPGNVEISMQIGGQLVYTYHLREG